MVYCKEVHRIVYVTVLAYYCKVLIHSQDRFTFNSIALYCYHFTLHLFSRHVSYVRKLVDTTVKFWCQ